MSGQDRIDRRAALGLLGAGAASVVTGCSTVIGARSPRMARALPDDLAGRYAVPEITAVRPEGTDEIGRAIRHGGRMDVLGHDLAYDFYVPARADGPVPFLLNLPILAGDKPINRMVCKRLACFGIASGTIERPGDLFRRDETLEELNENLVQTVRIQRAFVDWAAQRDEVRSDELGVVGVSMGGMVGTLLGAVEPRLRTLSLCLAGADFTDLLIPTTARRANAWGRQRTDIAGISMRELQARASQSLVDEPARLARYIETEKVLFVTARYDTTMPARNSDLLWEALGRPERKYLPFEHYTAILAIDWMIDAVVTHSRRRFAGLA